MNGYQLVLSPAAREDLIDIHRFGIQNWGKTQSASYLQHLQEQCWSLTQFPQIGVARNELLTGIRSIPVSSHVVFYRLADGCVEIVRILHRRQDPTLKIGK